MAVRADPLTGHSCAQPLYAVTVTWLSGHLACDAGTGVQVPASARTKAAPFPSLSVRIPSGHLTQREAAMVQ